MNGLRPAGFWIRALALVIDFVLFALVQLSFGAIAGRIWGGGVDGMTFKGTVVLFVILFSACYTIVLHALDGQTIGKALAGIRVVTTDGQRLPLGASLLRYIGYWISLGPTLTLGYLMAGLRQDKRALHDLIAGTRVERLRSSARDLAPPLAANEESLERSRDPDASTPST